MLVAAGTAVPTIPVQQYDSLVESPEISANVHTSSRLKTEFEELEVLGKGGFGDVVKVIACIVHDLFCTVASSQQQRHTNLLAEGRKQATRSRVGHARVFLDGSFTRVVCHELRMDGGMQIFCEVLYCTIP